MTTIALKGYTTLSTILGELARVFDQLGKAVIMSRGTEANFKIAQQLKHEYPNNSVAEIAHMLNVNLRKDVYGD